MKRNEKSFNVFILFKAFLLFGGTSPGAWLSKLPRAGTSFAEQVKCVREHESLCMSESFLTRMTCLVRSKKSVEQ